MDRNSKIADRPVKVYSAAKPTTLRRNRLLNGISTESTFQSDTAALTIMLDFVPLSFALESLHPPMELPDAKVREFYVGLADRCRFTEFKLLGPQRGAKLAENKNRHLVVTNDRVLIRDEFTRQDFTTFAEDVDTIYHAIRASFHVPVLLHIKVLIRFLLPHVGEGTTVETLQKGGLAGLSSALSHFERPISGIGLKVVFPPTQQYHSTFHLRLEPYFRDLKMFYLENDAQFFDPLVDLTHLRPRLLESYEFLKQQAGPFLLSLRESSPNG